jgi:hypothetical protein
MEKNTIKAINTYATTVLTFNFGIVKWTLTDLENLQTKTRTLLTRYRFLHPLLQRKTYSITANTVLTDIPRLLDKQVKLLQTYFLNKQATSRLHAAVVKADDRYTPLDLFRANENELAPDE